MFIRTERPLPAGKAVRVSCRLPGAAKPLILNGQVQRSEAGGVGLRLRALAPEQEKAIRKDPISTGSALLKKIFGG